MYLKITKHNNPYKTDAVNRAALLYRYTTLKMTKDFQINSVESFKSVIGEELRSAMGEIREVLLFIHLLLLFY